MNKNENKEYRLREIRAEETEQDKMIVEGYAIVFDAPTDMRRLH